MKIIALANDPDGLEKCINEYFCSTSYELVLVKRKDEKDKVKNIEYIIENKRLDQDKVIMINKDYSVIYKKGKYYFYRNEESKVKGRNTKRA